MHTRATGEDVKRGRVVLAQAHAARDEAHPALGESGSSILREKPSTTDLAVSADTNFTLRPNDFTRSIATDPF